MKKLLIISILLLVGGYGFGQNDTLIIYPNKGLSSILLNESTKKDVEKVFGKPEGKFKDTWKKDSDNNKKCRFFKRTPTPVFYPSKGITIWYKGKKVHSFSLVSPANVKTEEGIILGVSTVRDLLLIHNVELNEKYTDNEPQSYCFDAVTYYFKKKEGSYLDSKIVVIEFWSLKKASF